ncbi:hypothetical protein BDN71DRAFT_1434492 [Pleurotus eryngii]|uniref:Uncharacterized protein n=1 Tax=Pleurotus eryngii TaxID=5323 RepID=A0A9P6DCT9_PLEER|nr:hypothetical protein BDN71DRAFT_1434492 [Pleurotus eryngii]
MYTDIDKYCLYCAMCPVTHNSSHHSTRQLRRHGAVLDLTLQPSPPKIEGLFFPLYGHSAAGRRREFTTTRILRYGLPVVNVQEASLMFPALDSPTLLQATVTLSSSPKLRFKVYGYLSQKGHINEGLQRISPHIVWRGELVVFSLGERVPFLKSSWGGSQKNMHCVIRLLSRFLARVVIAMDSHERILTQIFSFTRRKHSVVESDGHIAISVDYPNCTNFFFFLYAGSQ